MQYRIWFVVDNKLERGAWWPFSDDALSDHLLGFFENFPGEFYDIEFD